FTSLAAILCSFDYSDLILRSTEGASRRMDFCSGPSFETAASRPPQDEVGLGDHAHDVGFFHDQQVLAVELHLGSRPLAEQHAVAGFEVDRDQFATLVAPARANRDNLTFG